MKRKRTRLENWFSFNQHKKRFGANKVADCIHDAETEKLKHQIIEGEEPAYTYGSSKDINEHIDSLRNEFIGQSELAYYHAKLIVLIRRDYRASEHFAQFESIWQQHADFLCAALNTRWLISACDTFIDCSEDTLLKATLLNACVLINTLKLCESERFLTSTELAEVSEKRRHLLQTERLALFDGTSGFAVGTDDTLRNMRWRLDAIAKNHELGGKILTRIFDNVQKDGNVYARFRAWHTRPKTAWWKV